MTPITHSPCCGANIVLMYHVLPNIVSGVIHRGIPQFELSCVRCHHLLAKGRTEAEAEAALRESVENPEGEKP